MPPYLQPDQPPVGGWILLGRIVFRDEQVQLPSKGTHLLGETPVVLEGCVQPPLKPVVLMVRGCQLRGNMVLGTDPGIELVLEVGVPVRQ